MARRYDPERRDRIIDAAIRVVGAKGIAGLSHRSVAAEADVPLGSTTYHFASLDELLIAALRRSNENFAEVMRESEALADPAADLAGELARLLGSTSPAGAGGPSWSTSCISPRSANPRCGPSPPSGPTAPPSCCPGEPIRPPRGR